MPVEAAQDSALRGGAWFAREIGERPLRKAGLKAVLALLAIGRAGHDWPHWDRVILIFSTAVTIGLIALYAYGKATSRW
jgi:hypothetical protein